MADIASQLSDQRDYLLGLEELLRVARTAREAVDHTCERLGRELDVAAVGLVELEPDFTRGFVVSEWSSGAIPPMLGQHHVVGYGAERLDLLKDGRPVVIDDIGRHPLTHATSGAIRRLGVEAFVEMPLLSEGIPRGWLYLSSATPRDWRPGEVDLARETLRRAWHAVERARAEEQLREREARLQAVLDQMPIGVILAAIPDGSLHFYNKAAGDIMGHGMLGRDLSEYGSYGGIHEDGRPYAAHEYPTARAITEGEHVRAETLRYRRPDGSLVSLSVSAAPVHARSGDIAVCTFQDETALHAAMERLRLQNQELDHRVKNMLATIQGIAAQTFSSPEERVAFEGRLQALAAANSLLTGSTWHGDLQTLAEAALRPFSPERFSIVGEPRQLQKAQAGSFALALHELATNAVKYGALSNERGHVSITWSTPADDPQGLVFVWQERGGPEVRPPNRRGFGSRMLERVLAAELRGRVSLAFEPEGLTCTLQARLPDSAARAAPRPLHALQIAGSNQVRPSRRVRPLAHVGLEADPSPIAATPSLPPAIARASARSRH